MKSALIEPRDEVLRTQRQLLGKLLRTVWNSSTFYRELYSSHGIREHQLADLGVSELPIIDKALLMENFDRAVTDSRLRRSSVERWLDEVRDPRELFERDFVVVHSSGSTGAIGIFIYSRTDWNVMNGIMADRLPQPENFPAGRTRVGFFRVAHGHFAGVATAVHLPNAVYDTLIVSMLEPAERAIEELQRFQPHRMTGYSSSIETIAHWAIEGRLRIAPQRIFVSGDLLTPSILKTIRQAWRAPISNLYGASESLFIGLQDVDVPEMTLMDDLNVIEVVDEENREVAPGQEGRVVLTNLYNHTLPILRYDLGDYVVRGKTLASGFSSIEGIRPGKTGEALPIVLDDGTPEMLTERALTSFYAPGLERAQFIFQEPGRVQIDYVAGNTIDDEIRKEFGRILAMKGASQMPLGTRRVASIAPDPRTGKVRLVVRPDPIDPPKQTLRVAGVQAGTQANTVRSPPDCADAEIGRSIPKVFERQVEQYPDRLAVKSGRDSLTYAELNRAANGVAHALLVRSGAASEPIGMMLSPGIGPVVAILGILKAGKFYVPLDPGFPRQRLKAIGDNAACAIIVTDDANIALVSALAHRAQLINIDALSPVPEDNPGLAIRPGSNAYLLYTSGSSGRPKGVIQSHRNVMHQLTSYAKGLNIGPLDRLTLLHAYGFSAARLDIFGALLSGAGLFHFSVAEEGLGQLARWLQEEEITLLHWVPTAFRHWGDVLDASDQFPRLRLVVLGSEALSWRDIESHRRHFSPACVLVNRFGTTETGNICWSFIDTHTQLADGAVAVGCAIEDTEVLILDDAGIGVGPGQIGEIAVASEYLSPGYWGQPELSRSAFVADAAAPGRRIYRTGDFGYKLPDGSVVHAGRKDLQIKIRGHRVEVAEIETALLAHPAIKEAAVAMGDEQAGDQRLLAYVVARGEPRPANAAIRAYLEPRVPAHMMPSGFVWMDKLPLTPSGKLDRLALSGAAGAGAARSTEFVAPRTPTEQTLSGIWSEVLAVDGIGVDDDFFDLGGHSLHAGRILGSVWQRFGVEVQFRDLFDSPTIAGMAQIIDRERTGS